MLVVIDTNVIFQGLDNHKGASFQILELLYKRKINIALSYPVICEYEDVLKRPDNQKRLQLTENDIDAFLAFIAYIAIPYDPTFLMRPNLRDENDNIFAELAFIANANYLVTSNIRDFTIDTELSLDNFKILNPHEFIKIWRKKNEK
jgi:putative PIN family toxin of toxin-antitoxin system